MVKRVLMFACSDRRMQEIEFNMLDYCFRCMLNSKYKKTKVSQVKIHKRDLT